MGDCGAMIWIPKYGANPYSIFTQTPGCLVYFDARDPANNGIQPSNGTALSTWTDKSGNGNNFTQTTVSEYPTFTTNVFNSLPAISFNSANNDGFHTTTGSILFQPNGSWTVYFVFNLNNLNEMFFLDSQGTASRFLIYMLSGNMHYQDPSGDHVIGAAVSGKQIISCVLNASGNTGTIYRNSTSLGSSTFTANSFGTSISLGIDYGQGFAAMNGSIGVFLIYNWAHDNTTRLNIERALGNVFGIPTL